MKCGRIGIALAALGLGFVVGGLPWSASPAAGATPQQNEKLHAAESKLSKAESLYKSGSIRPATDALAQAQAALVELADVQELAKQLEPLKKRLANLHDNMELDGAKVSAIPESLAIGDSSSDKPNKPAPTTTKPVKPVVAKTPPGKPVPGAPVGLSLPAAKGGGISFVRQVAPLLVGKCGDCHVRANKGRFSMQNYPALMRGAKDGVVLSPGKGEGSRIVDVIESGDMPRGGGAKVTPEELKMLTKWIDEGAKFDGTDPTTLLTDLVPGAPKGKPVAMGPKLEVAVATGRETVRFARDIAPVLVENCLGCHGAGNNPGGKLTMSTFATLLRGGDSGNEIEPGKPADSLLLRKLKGTAGERMPLKKPALSADVISKFEKWIAEGARFDGLDPGSPLDLVVEVYKAQTSTNEELSAARAIRSRKLWHLAIPDDEGAVKETKNFVLVGNVSEATLSDVATAAELQAAAVGRIFKVPDSKPLVKGRITLFVCQKKYDYSEFGRMLEGHELPSGAAGYFNYDVVNAYATIVPPTNGEYSLNALVAQQVAGLYVASLGRVPHWFAAGVGAAMGLRQDNRDPRLKQWESALPETLGSMTKPESFLNSGASEENNVLAMGFCKALMAAPPKFQQLINGVRQGQPFDTVFEGAYRMSPAEAATAWARRK
jgi:mono/diheme cytochrome c family protein